MERVRCPGCDYVYDPAVGDPHEGLASGTPIERIEPSLSCPDCGVREFAEFEPIDAAAESDR